MFKKCGSFREGAIARRCLAPYSGSSTGVERKFLRYLIGWWLSDERHSTGQSVVAFTEVSFIFGLRELLSYGRPELGYMRLCFFATPLGGSTGGVRKLNHFV